ncbi:MAG: hypothetical protein JO065_00160 [Acidobacteria bacterium]|nr:hypothetical protein [Acidobacteriota bacterium]MBV9435784.1 hypothetical protein [Acidobacteriota bacterium]
MLVPLPATSLDVWVMNVLGEFAKAATAATITIALTTAYLALRCKGRCREDSIFRAHVV